MMNRSKDTCVDTSLHRFVNMDVLLWDFVSVFIIGSVGLILRMFYFWFSFLLIKQHNLPYLEISGCEVFLLSSFALSPNQTPFSFKKNIHRLAKREAFRSFFGVEGKSSFDRLFKRCQDTEGWYSPAILVISLDIKLSTCVIWALMLSLSSLKDPICEMQKHLPSYFLSFCKRKYHITRSFQICSNRKEGK